MQREVTQPAAMPQNPQALANPVVLIHVLGGHTPPVYDAEFDPDGMLVLVGSESNAAHLWDITPAQPPTFQLLQGHHFRKIIRVTFTSDGESNTTASADSRAIVWNIRPTPAVNNILNNGNALLSMALSDDDRYLLLGMPGHHVFVTFHKIHLHLSH